MNSNLSPNNNQNSLVSKTRDYLKNKGVAVAPTPASKVKGVNNILDAVLIKGLITLEEYNTIKFESISTNSTFEKVLLNRNVITEDELTITLSEMRGIPFVDLNQISIPLETLNKIPANVAKSAMSIAFEETNDKVKVGMKDPLDLQNIKYLESILHKKIEIYFATASTIERIIDTKYGAQIGREVNEAMEEVDSNLVDINKPIDSLISSDDENAPIIKIVNMVLEYGVKHKASDIHMEPRESRIVVRFRIRGILSEKLTIPRQLLAPVISRIKILANLKIDEHRIPQDGRFQVKTSDSIADIRVSIMPSIYGEKIVMRILQKTQGILSVDDLGMTGVSLTRIKEALKKTQGIILVTGPTGSGKTQSLASFLKILNTPEVNITTLEDPVEIRVDGVNQVQVNPDVGLTFASGLRSFLRQDPDIIMVGEIRDSETANLAVQAALVGRLVISTVHTNSAAGAFIRMIDMGVEPFLLSSTVNLVIGQRLVRVLCECKQAYDATPEYLQELHSELDILGPINVNQEGKMKPLFDKTATKVTLYKPVGCPKCNDTGYISRTGIFEALKMSETISRLVLQKSTITDINLTAIKEGMNSMVQDGFIKALQGITTIEEVLRVKNE